MKYSIQIISTLIMLFPFQSLQAQVVPSIEWQKCLGGSGYDEQGYSVQQIADGGFILAGYSWSNNGDVTGNHGYADYWIVKLDQDGNLVWQKSLGGAGYDIARSIQQTTDGGFIVAGYSDSNDGDVSGTHGSDDYWVVKLDIAGNIAWQKSLGGSNSDEANSIEQTADGGFIVAGTSGSNDGDVSGNHGGIDYWVVKLDIGGNITWQKSLGGSNSDEANSVEQTTDGGFIVAGYSASNDGDVEGSHSGYCFGDYWVVKLDNSGNVAWQRALGGSNCDLAYSVEQTIDGGFMVAGKSGSNDGDVSGNHGFNDYWIVRLDTSGNLIWQKSLGGSNNEVSKSIQQTMDGGFIVAGSSFSNDGNVSGNHGSNEYWIVKLNSVGNLVWQKSLGGSYYDEANCIEETNDGGLIVLGNSWSNNGDVSGNHLDAYGNVTRDYWIVRLTSDSTSGIGSIPNNFISIFPNPVQTQLTINLSAPADDIIIHVYDLQERIQNCGFRIDDFGLSSSIQLNTENLPDGFYTLQIINIKTGEYEVGKFVKEN